MPQQQTHCLLWFQQMDRRLPSALYHSFYLQLNRYLLHARKPYEGINFLHRHFLEGACLDATKLFEMLNGL